ncbi:MAG: hypothetical protein MJ137_02180 [Clostridia bacterium]|nr:hypothetical protein [Clostridia bacterium]
MSEKLLRLGAAYHGNRMPHHAAADFQDMAVHGMDLIVHTFSHTDWDRHSEVMARLIGMSEEAGLEPWIDNWGLGGPPGDKSFFLALHPEAHIIMSDGNPDPVRACVNHPAFRQFTRDWIDTVYRIGGRTIFWDEPHLPGKTVDGKKYYGCTCPICSERFEKQYGHRMPEAPDDETEDLGPHPTAGYSAEMPEYSQSAGLKNAGRVMIGTYGMSLSQADKIAALPYMDNIGSDPYWIGKKKKDPSLNIYDFVRSESEKNMALCEKYGKDHNLWLQTYSNPRGSEEDIVLAAEAIYDAGARNIIAWGYYGSESNNYGAENGAVTWARTCDAMARLRTFERDRLLAAARAAYIAK